MPTKSFCKQDEDANEDEPEAPPEAGEIQAAPFQAEASQPLPKLEELLRAKQAQHQPLFGGVEVLSPVKPVKSAKASTRPGSQSKRRSRDRQKRRQIDSDSISSDSSSDERRRRKKDRARSSKRSNREITPRSTSGSDSSEPRRRSAAHKDRRKKHHEGEKDGRHRRSRQKTELKMSPQTFTLEARNEQSDAVAERVRAMLRES